MKLLQGVLLAVLAAMQIISASTLLELIGAKYPGVYEESDKEFVGGPYFILETGRANDFIALIDELVTRGEYETDPDLLHVFIFSFIPEHSSCQISREIFEKCLQIGPSINFLMELAKFTIFFDQEAAFDQLMGRFGVEIQGYETGKLSQLTDAILSRSDLFKFGKKMIRNGFRFHDPKIFAQHLCTVLGYQLSSIEYENAKNFLRFLILEVRLVGPDEIVDRNGLLADILV